MNRKNGMTSIEITISLALILLFFSMIFPILRMTLKLEGSFLFQERIERNSSRLVEMLTKEIESSSFGEEEYRGKENLINNAFKTLWKNECKVLFHQLNQSNNQY